MINQQKGYNCSQHVEKESLFAPKSVKSKVYQARVQPILEYASNCWAPTSKKLSNTLENVQHRAAKFVSNIYPKKGKYEHFSITKLLKNINWDSLEKNRKETTSQINYGIQSYKWSSYS